MAELVLLQGNCRGLPAFESLALHFWESHAGCTIPWAQRHTGEGSGCEGIFGMRLLENFGPVL